MAVRKKSSQGRPIYSEEKGHRSRGQIIELPNGQIRILTNGQGGTFNSYEDVLEWLDGQISSFLNSERFALAGREYTSEERAEWIKRYESIKERILAKMGHDTEEIKYFSQSEYNRVLDAHSARRRNLSQTQCQEILMNRGASFNQAKTGAYVYLHHSGNLGSCSRTTQKEYNCLLDEFEARNKRPQQCIRYLESLGFSFGQSKTAVNKYRKDRGLIRS
ncbi:MAG TPA: hypothetical protein VED00_01795 [archaeon]|nr:hypothetical protein [archaeon]